MAPGQEGRPGPGGPKERPGPLAGVRVVGGWVAGGGAAAPAGLPWPMSHEPLPINTGLSNELFDYIL